MKKIFTFLAAISCAVMVNATPGTAGAINAKFTINDAGDQVYFSQGNLQYQPSTGTWQFAEHQWDVIGANNARIADEEYDGFIDLFGWGTGTHPTDTSTNEADYRTFVDWGTNRIVNGGYVADKWYTLTFDEWHYILRRNGSTLAGLGSINGVYGGFLLPDDFVLPEGLTFNSGIDGTTTTNNYSLEDWNKMEAAGAVFLPATGGTRLRTAVTIGEGTNYWAKDVYRQDQPYSLTILRDVDDMIMDDSYGTNYIGANVRLVQKTRKEINACTFTTTTGDIAKFFSAGETWNSTKAQAVGAAISAAAGAPYYWNSNNANLYKWNETENGWERLDRTGTVLTAGKYCFAIQIRIDNTNAYDNQFVEDIESVSLKVDGVDWANKGGFVATPPTGNYSYFNAESPEFVLENTLITNVALSNVVFPEKGAELVARTMYTPEELGMGNICPSGAGYHVHAIRFMDRNGAGYEETALKPGTTYQMQFYMAAEPGYDFPRTDDGYVKISAITTTANGINRYTFVWDKDYCIFCVRITTSLDTITAVNLTVEEWPNYGDSIPSAVLCGEDGLYEIPMPIISGDENAYYCKGVEFWNVNLTNFTEETLLPNKTYKARFYVYAKEGHTLSKTITENDITVNGEHPHSLNVDDSQDRIIFSMNFTTGAPPTEIDEINISVVLPNTGDAVNGKYHENLYYSLTDGPAQITIPDDANYFMMVYWFLDENKQNFDEETFLPEKTYMFGICLIAPEYEGYIYANPVNALINGAAPNEVLEDAPHSKQYGVYFTTGKLEGIENTAAEVKATKVLRDGVLLIEKNGRTYNAQGAEIK